MRWLLGLGSAVATAFLGLMLWTTSGHFVAQISDLYVVAQYARALAEGHPFQYNAGEAPTTGATSLLHTGLLAAGHAAGARGEGLIAFAIGLGVAFFLGSIALAARIGARLAGRREGLLAGATVALGGPVVWGYLYGSDVSLHMFLALWLLDRWLEYWHSGSVLGLATAGCLLALARPEGLPVVLLLALASLFRPASRRAERLLPWAATGAGVAVLALQWAVTGSPLATSISEKSLLVNYGPVETLAATAKFGVDVARGLLLGFYPSEAPIGFAAGEAAFAFPPLTLLLVLCLLALGAAPYTAPLRAWFATVAVVFALTAPSVFMGVHFNRYLMWAFPGVLACTAVGLGAATRLLARGEVALERRLFLSVAGLFVALGLLSTARFAAVYSELAGETWRREIPMARWIRTHLPPGAAIANAATSIEYLTGHRNLNLHGVTSPDFVGGRTLEREASLFESLVRLPAAQRPPFLLLTRSRLESSALMPRLVDGAPLFETAGLGDDLVLYRARWDLLDRGHTPLLKNAVDATASLSLVDTLNVCDSLDEAAHEYRLDTRLGELVLGGSVQIDAVSGRDPLPLADAGRFVAGGEAFRVRAGRGRDLVVVMRTHSSVRVEGRRARGSFAVEMALPRSGIVVRANGHAVATLEQSNEPGWNEQVFRIPAESLAEDGPELVLRGRYDVFHYWFYQ